MKQAIRQATLAIALSASVLCAQSTTTTTAPTPPTPAQMAARMVARLTALLDLTSDQQATATTIFTAEATTDQAFATEMRTARTSLQTAITSNSKSGIAAAATTIGNLTAQQVQANGEADAAFYTILTTSQQTKYTTLRPLGGGPGGGRGPGGPAPDARGPGGPGQ